MRFSINSSCWNHYPREALCDIIEKHKFLFPDFFRPSADWVPTHAITAHKVCVELDIDRQHITRHGTPEQINALIHMEKYAFYY